MLTAKLILIGLTLTAAPQRGALYPQQLASWQIGRARPIECPQTINSTDTWLTYAYISGVKRPNASITFTIEWRKK